MDIFDIQTRVAQHFGIPLDAMLSRKRSRKFSYPRMIAIGLCREMTGASLLVLAKAFDRHHTTIMHSVSWCERHYGDVAKVRERL